VLVTKKPFCGTEWTRTETALTRKWVR
jgi:hypothetical protein